jgi:hypothetical protein
MCRLHWFDTKTLKREAFVSFIAYRILYTLTDLAIVRIDRILHTTSRTASGFCSFLFAPSNMNAHSCICHGLRVMTPEDILPWPVRLPQSLINNPPVVFRLCDHRSKELFKPNDLERSDGIDRVRDERRLVGRSKRLTAPALQCPASDVPALLVVGKFIGEDGVSAVLAPVDEVQGVILVHNVDSEAFEIAGLSQHVGAGLDCGEQAIV